jgi:hypothetical protein
MEYIYLVHFCIQISRAWFVAARIPALDGSADIFA